MAVNRREFLKFAGIGLGAALIPTAVVDAHPESKSAADSTAMLYDATICVGCRACQTACKGRAKLRHETDPDRLYEMPEDLTAYTWTIIKLYDGEEGTSFVKNQCMHCLEPACVSVCPVAALEKQPNGPVVYHDERCFGCRYCMAACPFGIPKTQWDKAYPLIQKCDFCADRQALGEQPACSAACPTGALISGTRAEMLEVAHARIQVVEKYDPYVYGEHEAGGTSMLYISKVNYKQLGLPVQSSTVLPSLSWPYMKAVPGVVAVAATLSTAIYLRTHREDKRVGKDEDHGS